MTSATKRKTSLSLDAAVLKDARRLGLNVSAVADDALRRAVAEARRQAWLEENRAAFAEQAEWHDRNGHPLKAIIASPLGATGTD